jgi:hypothetical protein
LLVDSTSLVSRQSNAPTSSNYGRMAPQPHRSQSQRAASRRPARAASVADGMNRVSAGDGVRSSPAVDNDDDASEALDVYGANTMHISSVGLHANATPASPIATTAADASPAAMASQVGPAALASRRPTLSHSLRQQVTARSATTANMPGMATVQRQTTGNGTTAASTPSMHVVQRQTSSNATTINAAVLHTVPSRRQRQQGMASNSTANDNGQHVMAAAIASDMPRVSRAAQSFTNQDWDPVTWLTVPASGPLNILDQNDEVLEVLRCAITHIFYYLVSRDAFPLRPARIGACREALVTAAQNEPQILNRITNDRSYRDWLSTVVSF